MAQISEVKVPDIGNYPHVPIIEVLVKAGDTVTKDQGLITLESDKATMEVPAPFDGVIKEIKVKLGDEVSEGLVVALIEASEVAAKTEQPAPPSKKAETSSAPDEVKVATQVQQEPPPSALRAASPPAPAAKALCHVRHRSPLVPIRSCRTRWPTPAPAYV